MPRELQLFLDENHHRNRQLIAALEESDVAFHCYGEYFAPQVADTEWMPFVAAKSWAVLTADKRIRYRPTERSAVRIHRLAMFCFTSNNMGGEKMARALTSAVIQMRRIFCEETPPFIATISESGSVAVRERFVS